MNQTLRSFLCALPALAGFADAQIDSGGGKAAVGSLTNHGSIGGIVATAPAPLGSLTLRNGLIEILYATAPLDPDADADGNGLPDTWEDEHFPGQNVVDPEADPDGDGTTNRMEYLAAMRAVIYPSLHLARGAGPVACISFFPSPNPADGA
jgi:hypothetical protein